MLHDIQQADAALTERYQTKLVVNTELDRKLVSFQANKAETGARWFKYKEGFSAALMRYLFEKTGLAAGHLLDPFAGAGTALFAASSAGMEATGIELLPSSEESIEVRRLLSTADPDTMTAALRQFRNSRVWGSGWTNAGFSAYQNNGRGFPGDH